MDKTYEAAYHTLEETHWWFAARRDFVYSLLQAEKRDAPLLEAGCSGGPLLLRLRAAGFTDLQGIDVSAEGIALAHARGFDHAYVMDAARTTFGDASFAAIVASDVLEHIADDAQALREWYRLLRPGGRLYVFVPAFMWLWSGHDVVNLHQRRYTAATLRAALQQAGFAVRRTSYWNCLLFFTIAAIRLLRRPFAGNTHAPATGDLKPLPPVVNRALLALLRFENALLRQVNLPVGVSVFCIAQKPGNA
jgi:SAM-dependent methyltransferase